MNQVRVGQVVKIFCGRCESGTGFSGFLLDEVKMEEALRDLWLTK
jgi:hypothetical protein